MKTYMLRSEFVGRSVKLTRYTPVGDGAIMECVTAVPGVLYDESFASPENLIFLQDVSVAKRKKPEARVEVKVKVEADKPTVKRDPLAALRKLAVHKAAQPISSEPADLVVKPEPEPVEVPDADAEAVASAEPGGPVEVAKVDAEAPAEDPADAPDDAPATEPDAAEPVQRRRRKPAAE